MSYTVNNLFITLRLITLVNEAKEHHLAVCAAEQAGNQTEAVEALQRKLAADRAADFLRRWLQGRRAA